MWIAFILAALLVQSCMLSLSCQQIDTKFCDVTKYSDFNLSNLKNEFGTLPFSNLTCFTFILGNAGQLSIPYVNESLLFYTAFTEVSDLTVNTTTAYLDFYNGKANWGDTYYASGQYKGKIIADLGQNRLVAHNCI